METKALIKQLERLAVETGSISCLGCGYEQSCGIHGCAVIRKAAEQLNSIQPQTQGKWIKKDNPNYSPFDRSRQHIFICNQCGAEHDKRSSYCEVCGANMRGSR